MRLRNPDNSLRALARQAQTDSSVFPQYISALQRIGEHPYWISVRERTPEKDTVFYDLDHKDELRWEDRPPSKDKSYIFKMHIPVSPEFLQSILNLNSNTYSGEFPLFTGVDDLQYKIFTIYLGEMTCFEVKNLRGESYLKGCVRSYRNLYSFDDQQRNQVGAAFDDIERIRSIRNGTFLQILKGTSIVFYYRAILNLILPINWNPSKLLAPREVEFLNDETRPFNNNYQTIRPEDPQIPEITKPFLLEDLLASHFMQWLGDTNTPLGESFRQEFGPLEPKLPTQYLGKQINLHYWLEYDIIRSIPADYYPERTAYDVAYIVDWSGDHTARFYRWGHDPGAAEGRHENGLSACEVVNDTESELEHQEGRERARKRAWSALQKRIAGMIQVAEKYGYTVHVIEGKP